MTLAISDAELEEAAAILVAAGVTVFKIQWRGILLVHQEGCARTAGEALELVSHMVQGVRGPVARRMLLDELEVRFKKAYERSNAVVVEVVH